jgi:dTDP-4-amino-4,6-dideoxygalactose transaminase
MFMDRKEPIYVTRPDMPPLVYYTDKLKQIWESRWLTNDGQFNQELERRLTEYLGIKNCSLVSNGTLALMIGLRSLNLKGEVITTPFSFVATAHSIAWNGLEPVFCDIEDETFNIDPEMIEEKITPRTSAILPVHVFGNPCEVERIEEIAERHDLKVIYDAAHAFGTQYKDRSVLKYGDLSALSFHATKVFNTVEGGALVTEDADLKKKFDQLRNFGFSEEVTVDDVGLNAKMNEFMAAYGLLELEQIGEEIKKRREISRTYHDLLDGIDGISLMSRDNIPSHSNPYFPIILDSNEDERFRDEVYRGLKKKGIHAKRYFYPLISEMGPYRSLPSSDPQKLLVSKTISENILCLPIYGELTLRTVEDIVRMIKKILGR